MLFRREVSLLFTKSTRAALLMSYAGSGSNNIDKIRLILIFKIIILIKRAVFIIILIPLLFAACAKTCKRRGKGTLLNAWMLSAVCNTCRIGIPLGQLHAYFVNLTGRWLIL